MLKKPWEYFLIVTDDLELLFQVTFGTIQWNEKHLKFKYVPYLSKNKTGMLLKCQWINKLSKKYIETGMWFMV